MAQYSTQTNSLLNQNNALYEVMMIANDYGVTGTGGFSSTTIDAFGRLRSSQPLTLFDSFTRYKDNGKFAAQTSTGGAAALSVDDAASIDMTVTTSSGSKVVRESKRVFAYQPGKSLQILNTFVLNEAKENLRQRVGYFDTNNGIFLELDGSTLYLVKRAYGSDIRVAQEDWNVDIVDGTGRSTAYLDITKAQIFWTDIEWLGVGSVRCGFVIDGVFIQCHTFQHANIVAGPYMATACLPVRLEIENTSTTLSSSKLKQICSTVISEGGYSLTGAPYSSGINLGSEKDLTSADTYYPVLAIRLRNDRRDAIVIPTGVSIQGISAGGSNIIAYRIYDNATITGGTWSNVDSASNVSINKAPTSFTGGKIISQGFLSISNQASGSVDLRGDLFKFQLKRNFDSCESFMIVAGSSGSGDDVIAAIDWEEII
jgi:hypothetical protein